jgi:general secretion pathway protein L
VREIPVRETLYIRLRDTAPAALTAYALVGDAFGGAPAGAPVGVIVREAPLEQVLEHAAGRRTIVFVAGADVRLAQIKVPARQPAKVLQAAPYALEDQLAEDVETLHFALGERLPDGSFAIAVVALSRLHEWLAPFRARDLLPWSLIPETLALPWDGTAWPVLAERGQITARTGPCAGFSCAPEDLEIYLQLAESGVPHPLRIIPTRGVSQDFTLLQRPLELLPGFDDALGVLVRSLRPGQAINLLQGAFSQRESLERFWRPWRLAGGLLAAACLLGVAVNAAQALRLGHALNRQQAANEARFEQLFPGERVASLPMSTQVALKQRMLRAAGNPAGVFFLLQQAAAALGQNTGLELRDLEFRDAALFLDLHGTDLQSLEKLRGWFAAHHACVLEVLSADSGEGGVQIHVKLSASPAAPGT